MKKSNDYLRVKSIAIEAGKPIVALHEKDAEDKSIHVGDRVIVSKKGDGKDVEIGIIDITDTMVARGEVGIFEGFPLKLRQGQLVRVDPGPKPASVAYIRKKVDGLELQSNEMEAIMKDVVEDRLSEIELSAFVTASYIYGYSEKETVSLTWAMVNSGEKIDLKGLVVDKHCIGGVPGNRTTMIMVPIMASLGVMMPKTSSRAITSPAGTADTMEVLAPVTFSAEEVKRLTEEVGGCIVWGGGLSLAPADDKIIQVEYPLSIDAEGQVLASIISKKKSVGSDYVLVDLPVGPGAKIEDRKDAISLGKKFVKLGDEVGMKVKYILTDGSNPIGKGIGPALEARDVLKTLAGEGSPELAEKGMMMAGTLLEFCGKAKAGEGKTMARKALESGAALDKMHEIIKAQGGKPIKPGRIKVGRFKTDFFADKKGIVKDIDNKIVALAARTAGAPKDPRAGIYLEKGVGRVVEPGEKLFTIYSQNKVKLGYAEDAVNTTNPYKIM